MDRGERETNGREGGRDWRKRGGKMGVVNEKARERQTDREEGMVVVEKQLL